MSKPRPLVMLHGWSDSSASLVLLGDFIKQHLPDIIPVVITLADYISMDDEVTYDDLVAAMSRAWRDKGLPELPQSVDILAHSTGALIVRHWMMVNYPADRIPIKRLVLLAPANFGSHLAHKGRAFYGRVLRGFSSKKPLQVGAKLLRGLELASPYTHGLARQDRFAQTCYYGRGRILCTVLIGDQGYRGIAAVSNEAGSDGTVRLASAQLNCARLSLDFNAASDISAPATHYQPSHGQTAFGIIPGKNHRTLLGKTSAPITPYHGECVIKALTITDQHFNDWCQQLTQQTKHHQSQNQTHQQTIITVKDQFNTPVPEYFLEFYGEHPHQHQLAEIFHTQIIQTVHPYQADNSYRSFYINTAALNKHLQQGQWEQLRISLTAEPELHQHGNIVGYRNAIGEGQHIQASENFTGLMLDKAAIKKLFVPNQTLFVDIILKREQAAGLFRLSD